MKYISFFILMAAFQLNASAQKITEANVPDAVKSSFSSMFKNTAVTQWELENGNYEASYLLNKVDNAALYSADGKFIQYERAVTTNDVPEKAINYITAFFPGKKIGDITQIKTITGDVSYEIEVGESDFLFDRSGNLIKQEKDTDTENEK